MNGLHTNTLGKINRNHPLNNGLVCYIPFNNLAGTKVEDLTGNNNNIVINSLGVNTSWSASPFSGALRVNGSVSNAVVVTLAKPLDCSSVSLCGWVYFETSNTFLVMAHVSTVEIYLGARTSGTPLAWARVGTVVNGNADNFAGTVVANKWYHIAVTNSNNTLKMYVNGNIAGSFANPTPIVATSSTLSYGGGGTGRSLTGSFCEQRVYSRALSQTEVQVLYNNPRIDWVNKNE